MEKKSSDPLQKEEEGSAELNLDTFTCIRCSEQAPPLIATAPPTRAPETSHKPLQFVHVCGRFSLRGSHVHLKSQQLFTRVWKYVTRSGRISVTKIAQTTPFDSNACWHCNKHTLCFCRWPDKEILKHDHWRHSSNEQWPRLPDNDYSTVQECGQDWF